jgi:Tfp pilus assembly protein PilF
MSLTREKVTLALIALVLVTPALLLGAVHEPVLAFYLFAASVMFGLLAADSRQSKVPLDLGGALFAGLALFTLFQLIPLPTGLVELISPAVHEVRTRALKPLGMAAPAFMPLTLDATLTAQELGKLLLYLAVYLTCRVWARHHGSTTILRLVALTGTAGAAVFLTHKILLLDQVYGVYTPVHLTYGITRSSAPLINENHMAALLGLGASVAIGLALESRERSRRLLLVGISALIGASLLITLSRGGIAAFLCGQCLFVALWFAARRRPGRRTDTPFTWIPLGLAFSLGLALFTAQDAILGEFLDGDIQKLDLFAHQLPLIGQFWPTGVGRGAFWVAFPLVSDLPAQATFTHAENAVIQLLADYGLLIGPVALVGFITLVGRFLRRPPRRLARAAALSGLVAFGLHNLVDFNMEIPGVAVLAVALLAVLQSADKNHARYRLPTPALLALGGGALVMAGIVGFHGTAHNIDREEISYRKALGDPDSKLYTPEALAGVLARHPANWYIPFLVGVRHYYQRGDNPLPWLSRAMELNPSSGGAHLYAGRVLLRADRLDQAMFELRLAVRYRPTFARAAADYLVSKVPAFDRLSAIGVTAADKVALWGALAGAFGARGLEEQAEKADRALLGHDPGNPGSLARHGRRLAGRARFPEALGLAERLAATPQHAATGIQLQAEISEKMGDRKKAISILEKGLADNPKHPALIRALALVRQRSGDHPGALEAAAQLKTLATESHARVQAILLEARLSKAAGRLRVALARFEAVHTLAPQNREALNQIANLSERLGYRPRALGALRKLKQLDPENPALLKRVNALEKESFAREQ